MEIGLVDVAAPVRHTNLITALGVGVHSARVSEPDAQRRNFAALKEAAERISADAMRMGMGWNSR